MGKVEDIAKLDRSIKDAEIRMCTIESNVLALIKELDLLANKEKSLEENIKCLKKNRIIAIAQEFKKAKEELRRISSRILILTNDKQHFIKTSQDMKSFIEKAKKELEKLQTNNDNNILQFRSKNGQE